MTVGKSTSELRRRERASVGETRKKLQTYPSAPGIAILSVTTPVSTFAALTSPSVPALYRRSPLQLNATHLQLPLCLLVLHAVSISPSPLSDANIEIPSLSSSSSSSEGEDLEVFEAAAGSLYVWTWPADKPTDRIGAVGWIA